MLRLNVLFAVDFPLTIEMNSADAVCVVGTGDWTTKDSASSNVARYRCVLTIQIPRTPIRRGRSRLARRALPVTSRTSCRNPRRTRSSRATSRSGRARPRKAAAKAGTWSCRHARSRRSVPPQLEKKVPIVVEDRTCKRVRVHKGVVVLPSTLECTDLLHELVEIDLDRERLLQHVHRVPELCRSALGELCFREGGVMGAQGVHFDATPDRLHGDVRRPTDRRTRPDM